MNKQTRELPMLTTRAALQPQSFDDTSKTCELVWSTGAQVRRFDWFDGPFIEELDMSPEAIDMTRLNSGAPLLDTHDCYELESVIGVVERAWIDNGLGHAVVRFSERKEIAPIVADVKAGIIRNVSVGYQVHEYEITAPQDGSMPTYRATKWEPYELSLVPIGADAKASVRKIDERHPVSITHRSPAMSDPIEETPVEATAPESLEPVAEVVESPAPAPDVDSAVRSALAVERQRIKSIRSYARMAGLDEQTAESLVDSDKSQHECEMEILRMWSKRVDASATVSGRPDGDVNQPKSRAAELAQGLLKQVAGV
jgi:phage head maturation protease